MTQKMRDDEFEGLLGRALRSEPAPAGLQQRLLKPRNQSSWQSSWLIAFVSPGRLAASAAILSLMMGFALGWGNSTASADGQDLDVASVLYAANDVGDF